MIFPSTNFICFNILNPQCRDHSKEAVRVIEEHDTNHPLFLYLAYQGVHSPGQVPESYVKPYENTISSPIRRTFAGMLSAVDEGIGNVPLSYFIYYF